MTELITRKATADDLPILYSFEQNLINTERNFDPTIKRDHTRYYNLQEMISAPHVHLIVAELGDKIVGSGYARIDPAKSFIAYSRYAYLGFMYVDPGYRKQGINKSIMAELKRWAIEQKMTEMRLEVYYDNLMAIKAYEKAGFTPLTIEMRMSLQ
jgi:ribosomal protein S18 acetylase RimI-like enzyme